MKIKIGLFFGGKSVEHEVSIITALQAANNLNKDKYEIVNIYLARDGSLYTGDALKDIANYRNIKSLLANCVRVIPVSAADGAIDLYPFPFKWRAKPVAQIEVAFPVAHGTNVEDGTLQGYLRTLGLPLVGCDVGSSALGMDKYAQKLLYKDAGIPVLDALRFTAKEYEHEPTETLERLEAAFPYPIVVKPLNLGSSIGVTLAANRAELSDAIELAVEFSSLIIAEKAVSNLREINCSVLGDCDNARASECEEPISADDILTYEDKYIDGAKSGGSKGMAALKRLLPAPITAEQKAAVQDYAVRAFKALGCSGVSRIDFLMDRGSGEIWINEINTIPGSLAFYLWEATGLKYIDMLDELISLALKRQRQEPNYAIETGILANFAGGSKGSKS